MCGRYSLTSPEEAMRRLFDIQAGDIGPPRYNLAPSQLAPVARRESADGPVLARLMRWGLVPGWARDESIGQRLINARSETAAEKPSFRAAFRQRRCLVPADGFYEWRNLGSRKQPYWISRPEGEPFAMAGLWESWRRDDGPELLTFTILTTEATEDLRPIHHRMPVILPPEAHAAWLDQAETPSAELFVSGRAPELRPRAVSTHVNRPANDDAECLRPLDGEAPVAGTQPRLL
ncbi:MAG: SOS response-associated peptidase [Alphaproteobacteria bacterium]|jgi:putative SOS response-associated peptidase YedK|nr:SOS response-associated peptidase [Alphaproteobacteria bacterium]MDP6567876.1 SOS response-associated peptidase [Alphaproteobacteria bacterium]MDP6813118.1 SOS response-associated peptidase [Alphaproteobacteria bacterium]